MSELETPNDNSVRAMKVLFFFLYGGRTGSEVALHNLICNRTEYDYDAIKRAVTIRLSEQSSEQR